MVKVVSQQPGGLTSSTRGTAFGQVLRSKKAVWTLLLILLLVATWVTIDLYGPGRTSLRQFDPNEVASLETAMWRSYYERHQARLFLQLAGLLRKQYHMHYLRSNLVAYQAAKAAFVFKDGQRREDYEKALPYLVNYYAAVRQSSLESFDVDRVASLELEWWIVHRERASHAPWDLDRALAEPQAEIFHLPAERFLEHGRFRAEAMEIRDTKAAAGGVTEEDWTKIEALLRSSWQSLRRAAS